MATATRPCRFRRALVSIISRLNGRPFSSSSNRRREYLIVLVITGGGREVGPIAGRRLLLLFLVLGVAKGQWRLVGHVHSSHIAGKQRPTTTTWRKWWQLGVGVALEGVAMDEATTSPPSSCVVE